MRLTYVIRRINAWFARVVFERDAWDVRLARYAGAAPWQAGLLLHGARACVWVTRRILWALMHVGHGISCFMLRQMEYDADSYEAKLVGGEVFETTITRLRVLSVATHLAYEDVQQYWGNRRLPANLLLLIESKSTSLPKEIHRKITTVDPAEKTGWFNTHPCDADRIRAVRQLNEKGIFHATAPATRLFSDFAGLSQAATRHQYEKHFELEFTDQDLISADELSRESIEHSEADVVIERYYGAVNPGLHPLLIERHLPSPGEPAAWRAACTEIDGQREQAAKISAACVERLERRHKLQSAYYLAMANFEFPPADFGLPDRAASVDELRAAAEAALRENETAIEEQLVQLEPFFAVLRRRIGLALAMAAEENVALIPALVAVGAEMKQALVMAARLSALTVLAENRHNHPDTLHVDHEAFKLASDVQRDVLQTWERLGGLVFPFAHPRGSLTIANYLQVGQSTESTWQSVHEGGLVHVNRLIDLHHRLLGRVLALADRAEKALGHPSDPSREGV